MISHNSSHWNTHRILVILIGASGVGKSTLQTSLSATRGNECVVLHRTTNRSQRDAVEAQEVTVVEDSQFDSEREAGNFVTWYERYSHKYAVSFAELQRVPPLGVGVIAIPAVAIPLLRERIGPGWDVYACWLDITPDNRELRLAQRTDDETAATREQRLAVKPIDHTKNADVKIDANGSRESVAREFNLWLDKVTGKRSDISAGAHTELSIVRTAIEQQNRNWCLFGGLAAKWHGEGVGRVPTDLDLLVAGPDLQSLAGLLPNFNLKKPTLLEGEFCELRSEVLSLHVDGVPYPFIFDEEAAARCVRMRMGTAVVPVMSAEDTIVMKCILQRGENRGKFDLPDVQAILRAKQHKLDRAYMRVRAERASMLPRVAASLEGFGFNLSL